MPSIDLQTSAPVARFAAVTHVVGARVVMCARRLRHAVCRLALSMFVVLVGMIGPTTAVLHGMAHAREAAHHSGTGHVLAPQPGHRAVSLEHGFESRQIARPIVADHDDDDHDHPCLHARPASTRSGAADTSSPLVAAYVLFRGGEKCDKSCSLSPRVERFSQRPRVASDARPRAPPAG